MKLFVEKDWRTFTVRLYLKNEDGRRDVFYGYKDGKLIEQIIDDTLAPIVDNNIPVLMEIPEKFFNDFAKAFADYLSGNDITTENENLLKGKLMATEKHLEDMRKHFEVVLNKVVSDQ